MTDSMIERIAQEIFPELWDEDADHASTYPLGRKRVEDGRAEAFKRARAVLTAMREPSEAMKAKGAQLFDPDENGERAAEIIFQDMIGTALEDGQHAGMLERSKVIAKRFSEVYPINIFWEDGK